MNRPDTYPQWCLVCAATAHDNACGHFTGPLPPKYTCACRTSGRGNGQPCPKCGGA